jgi:hypothetical protein
LRMVLPTWESYESKLSKNWTFPAWEEQIQEIYKEYTYEDHHEQSVMDNSTDSKEMILDALKNDFVVEYQAFDDAFIDKVIGGLRGEHRHRLAAFLKFLDDYLVKQNILPPTSITIVASKK